MHLWPAALSPLCHLWLRTCEAHTRARESSRHECGVRESAVSLLHCSAAWAAELNCSLQWCPSGSRLGALHAPELQGAGQYSSRDAPGPPGVDVLAPEGAGLATPTRQLLRCQSKVRPAQTGTLRWREPRLATAHGRARAQRARCSRARVPSQFEPQQLAPRCAAPCCPRAPAAGLRGLESVAWGTARERLRGECRSA